MADHFTNYQISELREMFNKFDSNGDNSISTKEFAQLLKSLGSISSQFQIKSFIEEVDFDQDGIIQFGEFLNFLSRKMADVQTQDELRDVFEYFDTDKDGFISPKDLKDAISSNHSNKTITHLHNMIVHMINEVDIDEDGLINYHEFLAIMQTL